MKYEHVEFPNPWFIFTIFKLYRLNLYSKSGENIVEAAMYLLLKIQETAKRMESECKVT